ncbi:hypothetical protein BaRGS_00009174 [Batillaria attramentaria]|uniref:Uncharacterized protein n=1 Tax=Batillaria attramentaria TaxID=370345 RepID=A0ABD0LJN0_9CAEN
MDPSPQNWGCKLRHRQFKPACFSSQWCRCQIASWFQAHSVLVSRGTTASFRVTANHREPAFHSAITASQREVPVVRFTCNPRTA